MPLKLIHGPLNSGRAGLVRRRFTAVLERDPILVVPNEDDVFAFERELCEDGAVLGGSAMTFGALFRTIATAAGAPPGAELSAGPAAAGDRRRGRDRPGRGWARCAAPPPAPASPAPSSGCSTSCRAPGSSRRRSKRARRPSRARPTSSDIATLFAAYAAVRDRIGRIDTHGIAREAIALLRRDGGFWGERPVFLYGLDDLTPNQLELVEALAARTEVTVALPFEPGNTALVARARLLVELRERIGAVEEEQTAADPANTESALLFHLARGFGAARRHRAPAR